MRKVTPVKLSAERIASTQKTHGELIAIARPIMEDIYQFIERSDSAVVLVNGAGYVLDMLGDPSMMQTARPFGIEVGGSISEMHLGTNALALPLLDGVPSRTVGAEHYLEDLHWLAGAAAPVFSLSGRPLGALGILSFAENYHPHTLGLAVTGAKAIEGQIQIADMVDEQNSQLSELNTVLTSMTEGILVWDSLPGTILQANPVAMRILNWPVLNFVGKPLADYVHFPEYIDEALKNRAPVKDIEATIFVGEQIVNCVVSLNYVPRINAPHWVIMTLRPAEVIHQLVHRQTGAQVSFSIADFVGKSTKIQQVRRMARAAAPAQAAILLRGESGTGKNVLARAIHQESSRASGPFLIFSCGSTPNEFILPELLGVEEGTHGRASGGRPSKFELAQGGTMYFQDVDQLPLKAQTVLCNVMDLGIVVRLGSARPIPVNVRIIASTSVNLEELITNGGFHPDLYYRLSPFEIELPPL
ncbi:MAG TPA: sigma 54-interacting transcriptional regulator, partial [Anaerolineales bacterium]|nr:sigma 54-interacting transcriptional regulator [Anaerolineales bacterium]